MFLALRDMWHAKGRFGLMSLVVTLVAFLVVVLGGLIFGLIKDCVSALQELPATHMAFENSTRPDYQNSMLDQESWEKWAEVPGVIATPIGHALVNARDAAGTPVDIAFWGVVPGSFAEPKVIDGQGLAAADNAMVISRKIALDKGVKIGDTLIIDRVLTEFKVVGIAGAVSVSHAPVAYVRLRKWQEASYGPPGGAAPGDTLPEAIFTAATAVALAVAPQAKLDLAELDKTIGTRTMTKEQSYNGTSGYSAEIFTVRLMQFFLVATCVVVLGAFFSIWTVQRTAEIGLVKALGASNSYLVKDALGQVLLILVVATALGVLAAIAVTGAFEARGSVFELTTGNVVGSSVLLIAAGLLGALFALRRIVKIEPIIALGRDR
jgi:putative ABC transport system permease protein